MLKLLGAGKEFAAPPPQIMLPSTGWVMLPSEELVYADKQVLLGQVKECIHKTKMVYRQTYK